MIPHILHIKNFLSYGPEVQIIDFRPYNLISLSGKNGHGKSALLDAITWAIWGQARKSSNQSKPDAGLMHIGQKYMMVILEFEVNGRIYRVRREYLITQSKSFATLDFGVQSPEGKLIALTDKTIKDTQDKIEKMIGITYDSFTNSTFLRQGQSNEFSKKTPKERKEVLAKILQLEQFENQKKIARLHARKMAQEYQTKINIAQRIEQDIQELNNYIEQYQNIEHDIANLLEKRQALQQTINHENDLLKQHMAIKNEIHFLHQQITTFHSKKENISQEILQYQTKSNNQNNITIEQLEKRETSLKQQLQEKIEKQQKKLEYTQNYFKLKESIHQATSLIDTAFQQKIQLQQSLDHAALQSIKHLQQQVEQEEKSYHLIAQDYQTKYQQYNHYVQELTKLEEIEKNYESDNQQYDKIRQEYQQICAQGTYTKQHVQNLQLQQESITKEQNAFCLLCQQQLSIDQQNFVIQKLQQDIVTTQQDLQNLKHKAQALKEQITARSQLLQNNQQQYELYLKMKAQHDQQQQIITHITEQKDHQQQRLLSLQKSIQTHLEQSQHHKKNIDDLKKDHTQVLQDAAYQQNVEQLEKLYQCIEQLTIEEKQYENLEQELVEISKQLTFMKSQPNVREQAAIIQQLTKQQEEIELQIYQLQQKINLHAAIDQIIHQAELMIDQYQKQLQTLQYQQQQAMIIQATKYQQQKRLDILKEEFTILNTNITFLKQEVCDYQEIAKALGKDGIQALLIEQAIPEIEYETNQILSRLTNNQTQIFIESLRDLKKGGSKETLDIKISDPFGIRDYEMFSGGEAFRIDFALRIGISKLLARRAGTALQTIFIDEGFGSQDDEGLSLIMDNIYKIQEDFAKIIIVSHLPEMKEQFPVQFLIEKKRTGSIVSIMQQG